MGDRCYNGPEGHIMWECGLDASGLGEGLVLGHSEHSNESSGSAVSHIIVQLSKCKLL